MDVSDNQSLEKCSVCALIQAGSGEIHSCCRSFDPLPTLAVSLDNEHVNRDRAGVRTNLPITTETMSWHVHKYVSNQRDITCSDAAPQAPSENANPRLAVARVS
jgi:hypothetical protein